MATLDEIKQRIALLEASFDTEFEVWVSFEVGKYWHEDVPFLLRYIEKLEKSMQMAKEMFSIPDWDDPAMDVYNDLYNKDTQS